MKKHLGPKLCDLGKSHLVYEYLCQKGASKQLKLANNAYDELTTCKLSQRLSYHLQNDSIKTHNTNVHMDALPSNQIVNST